MCAHGTISMSEEYKHNINNSIRVIIININSCLHYYYYKHKKVQIKIVSL